MRAWKGMPPVKGIRIDLSNNHTVLNAKGQRVPFFDMCDELQGVYPKDFKFTGWHPFCRCFAVPITASWDEIEAMWEAENRGKDISDYHFKDEVADMPKAFTDWIKKNEGRIEKAKNMPYFIRDNYKGGEVGNGLRWMPEKPAAANGGSVPADKSIQSGGEEKDELSKLAKAVGVDLGAPMAHEQADMKHPNPHYSEAEEYRVNCQSAVVAYELRRRGLPVEAYGKTVGSMADKLAFKTQTAWLDAKGYMPEPMTFIRYPISRVDGHLIYSEESEVIKDFLKNTSKVGRYHLYWTWKETECGHIITMETFKDGTRRFYDPQTGKESTTIMPWFKPDGKVLFNVKTHALRAYRVDTLRPNPLIVKGVVKKAGSGLATPMMTAEQKEWWKKVVNGGVKGNTGAASGLLTVKDVEKILKNGGELSVHPSRLENANRNKQERAKFEKEYAMCETLARNGHNVKMIQEIAGVSSPDILIDGRKADLKSTKGTGNNVKYGKKAVKKQDADIVIFEFEEMSPEIQMELKKLALRLGIHGMYFVKGNDGIVDF